MVYGGRDLKFYYLLCMARRRRMGIYEQYGYIFQSAIFFSSITQLFIFVSLLIEVNKNKSKPRLITTVISTSNVVTILLLLYFYGIFIDEENLVTNNLLLLVSLGGVSIYILHIIYTILIFTKKNSLKNLT